MGKKIPTKEEVQNRIDEKSSDPRQIIISDPKRYARGKEKTTRIWVEVRCSEHGPYPTPIRLDTLLKCKNRCYWCGLRRRVDKRTRSEDEIKKSVEKWSKERNFPVNFVGVSNDRKTTFLQCDLHGRKEKSTGKVVNSGQLCEECAFELPSGGHISFEEKLSLYMKKFNPPLVIPLREGPRKYKNGIIKPRDIFYQCLHCNGEFPTSWSNIYNNGIRGCSACLAKITGKKQIADIKEIQNKLNIRNIEIFNINEYKGTHYPLDLVCKKCSTKKKLKINTVLTSKIGMSCKCTRAIPNICHDYIFNHLFNLYPDAISRKIFKNKKIEADIFLPSLNMIVEVKYGDSPFGRENARGQAKKRYEHIIQQAENYSELNCDVIYLIIAESKNIELIPNLIKKFKYYSLDDDASLKKGPLKFTDQLLKELFSLYKTPFVIRSKDVIENKEKALIREKLKKFLEKNNLIYPSQKHIKKQVGYSQRKVDSALWIKRNSKMKDRIAACQYWFGIKVTAIRKLQK